MKTQAMGWLIAGVLAAGLNASYHDGGLEWAHQVADRVGSESASVVEMASGRANEFLTEARLASPSAETPSCPLSTTLARVQAKIDRSQAGFDRLVAISDREQAQFAIVEANRARIEADLANIRIPDAAFRTVVVNDRVICPRIRVNVPRMPMIKLPVIKVPATPEIRIESPGSGPV